MSSVGTVQFCSVQYSSVVRLHVFCDTLRASGSTENFSPRSKPPQNKENTNPPSSNVRVLRYFKPLSTNPMGPNPGSTVATVESRCVLKSSLIQSYAFLRYFESLWLHGPEHQSFGQRSTTPHRKKNTNPPSSNVRRPRTPKLRSEVHNTAPQVKYKPSVFKHMYFAIL